MITSAMQTGMITNTSYVEFGDSFDLEQVMLTSGGEALPGAVFDNPSPGVYTMAYAEEGFAMTWSMSVMSEALIRGEYFMDMTVDFGCTLTIPFTVEYAD
jgi:hypothetical protein